MWHRRSPKQRIWMGSGRHICGCDRRIPFANTHSNCNSYCYSHSDSDGNGKPFSNRNRYSDANRQCYADSYSHWLNYTEAYSYS